LEAMDEMSEGAPAPVEELPDEDDPKGEPPEDPDEPEEPDAPEEPEDEPEAAFDVVCCGQTA